MTLPDPEFPNPEHLAELRRTFGVDDGSSALGWPAVHAFEAESGIVLTEPYRAFVAEISDGSYQGPPEYGFLGLAEMPADWGQGRPTRDLSAPFPLTKAWIWEDEDLDEADLDAALGPVFDHGSVVLGTDGCGMYWHLIVTGGHRGHIWNICGEGAAPFGTEFGQMAGEPGFLGWVRHWDAGEESLDAV
jgi:hypothetical protein